MGFFNNKQKSKCCDNCCWEYVLNIEGTCQSVAKIKYEILWKPVKVGGAQLNIHKQGDKSSESE